ncbi:MAG TPA: hypothetical protein VH415_10880 [Nitrososphaeraceae archaeon]|jgi:predicted GH43/DUF377 family glycosyl hydrolase
MVQLERAKNNPILIPNRTNWWESKAVFNCSVLYDGITVHMLYRAIGEYHDYVSRIGYACSNDGIVFHRRNQVAICPEKDFEKFGMEDPRLSKLGNQIIVSYVVLSDYVRNKPTAATALAITRNFCQYERLGIVTPHESDNKDVVFFSIGDGSNGTQEHMMMLHRPSKWIGTAYGTQSPGIWLSEGDLLSSFNKHSLLLRPQEKWEQVKIGAGPAPIKTRKGWLVLYHGVSLDGVYSTGAFLMDLKNPYTVLGRTRKPILVPEAEYEKKGDVSNVVFPCGACVIGEDLYVYYGGADKVCCLATIELDSLLEYVLSN